MNNIQKAEAQIVVVINHEFQCVQEASITIISFVTLGDLAGRSNKKKTERMASVAILKHGLTAKLKVQAQSLRN